MQSTLADLNKNLTIQLQFGIRKREKSIFCTKHKKMWRMGVILCGDLDMSQKIKHGLTKKEIRDLCSRQSSRTTYH